MLAYKDMSDYIEKVVAPLESKVEELILHILPRALWVTIVVRVARPKSVINCNSKIISLF